MPSMAYDMLTDWRRRLNVVNLEVITTYSGSLFHRAITLTAKYQQKSQGGVTFRVRPVESYNKEKMWNS